jgi:hypothetical protein
MLSTDLPTFSVILSAVALLVACVCMFIAARAHRWAVAAIKWTHEYNADSLSLKQLAELEAQMTDLYDSYSALLASHKKLRSRIGMREVREKRRSENFDATVTLAEPDPQKDPEGWKRHMRAKLGIGVNK